MTEQVKVGGVISNYLTKVTIRAANRGLIVDITLQDLADLWCFQNGMCALTGWSLTLKQTSRDYTATASVDRIDPMFGYIKSNIQWCHKDVNTSKWDHPEEKFFEICRSVTAYKDETKKLREGRRPWLGN